MCGFTGYFYFDDKKEASNKAIREMLALQKHRGPDDSGIVGIDTLNKSFEALTISEDKLFKTEKNLVFGFNRLSILDLSPMGHQPMISQDEQVIMMMNGEIYNAFDFKAELEEKGHVFKSTTDTELVLHLYLEYGMEKMIKMLNGMFALAIYDMNLNTLFLARDRFGIKPLYIINEAGRIAFASEMKSFKALPNFKFELDDSRLDEFLLFRNVVNNTLFKNIINCNPGTYLSVNNGEISTHTFYDINEEGLQTIASKDSKNALENALKKSVTSQMISDVKLGSQLSGGVDSSLVSYYADQALANGNLETISIVFNDTRFSEEKYIDIVAKQLSLQSHKYEMEADYYFDVLEKAIWHFEQPLNHPNTIGIYLLSQEAKKHVTVLLSGEGADESLAGYSRFITVQQFPYFRKLFWSSLKKNIKHATKFLSYYFQFNQRLIMATAFGSITTASVLLPRFNFKKAVKERMQIFEKLKGTSSLKQRKYEILTYLPDLLMRQDKMSMAHSIENRVPFLDNEMVTTSLNISDLLLTKHKNKSETKVMLKDICADKFGESFAYREKMGFGIPLRAFMSSDVFQKKWISQVQPGIKKRAIFNCDSLSNWVKNSAQATPDQLDAIWLMVGFELWAQQYLD